MLTVDLKQDEGFIRLTTEYVQRNLLEVMQVVVFDGIRIVLTQAGNEVAAIIPINEFEKLENLQTELICSADYPDEWEYDEDKGAIHCVFLKDLAAEFDDILEEVKEYDQVYGFLPPQFLSNQSPDCIANPEFYIFAPVVILMNIKHFWIPDYLLSESQKL